MKTTVLALALLAAPLWAVPITNGGFETGDLTGWTLTGNVRPIADPNTGLANVLNSSGWSPFSPQSGSYYAELSNAPWVNQNSTDPADYSEISTGLYYVGTGSSISFYYILGSNELNPIAQDFGLFSVVSQSGTTLFSQKYSTADLPTPSGGTCSPTLVQPDLNDQSNICVYNGWVEGSQNPTPTWVFQQFDLSAYQGQNVRFVFRVEDSFEFNQDNSTDTVLLLDNVTASGLDPVGSVPEPATFVLGGTALVALYLRRRAARS